MKPLIDELRGNAQTIDKYVLKRAADCIEQQSIRIQLLEEILCRALPVVTLAQYPKLAERILNALGQKNGTESK